MLLRLVTAFVLGTATLTAIAEDHAHHMTDEKPAVTQAWSRAMPPTAPTGAVYFLISNPGKTADKLVGVQTPRADKAELHTHVQKGEVMSMEQIESVELAPGGEVAFKPGGNHVMLFQLTEPLVAGEHFPLTLIFEKAGEVTVEVGIHDQAPESDHNGHHQH